MRRRDSNDLNPLGELSAASCEQRILPEIEERAKTWAVSRNWSAVFWFVVDVEIKNVLEYHFCVYLSFASIVFAVRMLIVSAANFYIDL